MVGHADKAAHLHRVHAHAPACAENKQTLRNIRSPTGAWFMVQIWEIPKRMLRMKKRNFFRYVSSFRWDFFFPGENNYQTNWVLIQTDGEERADQLDMRERK